MNWAQDLRSAFLQTPESLLKTLGIPIEEVRITCRDALKKFPLVVSDSYVNRMSRGDINDPLLLQVLPHHLEDRMKDGFGEDPVGEISLRASDSLIQKYEGRALIVTTSACAVHCRYCFRRHFPYASTTNDDEIFNAICAVAEDTSLKEIILSGGDPLVINDVRLEAILKKLEQIQHLKIIRIHTRIPVVLPSRITDDFVKMLLRIQKKIVLVIHANHAQELRDDCAEAIVKLTSAGIHVLNQAVLLFGINDDALKQEELSFQLLELGVMPYYLHQLDRVSGAAHFEVDEKRGRDILASMRSRMPGYLVPRYVREISGAESKVTLELSNLSLSGRLV